MARGDHVRVFRGLYWHHGIDVGQGIVVHFAGEPGSLMNKKKARICRTRLDRFARGGEIEVVEYESCLPPEEVAERAKSKVGQTGYDLLFNNCEHFATWCKTGRHRSEQISSGVSLAVRSALRKKPSLEEFYSLLFATKEDSVENEHLRELIELILKGAAKIPGEAAKERLREALMRYKELLMESRAPRIVVVGRRGAGKSSLINAIFGEKVADVGSVLSQTGNARWYEFKNEKGSMDILDTRGLGDRTRPEDVEHASSEEDIRAELSKMLPDVLLFLCKAKDVDSHIARDVDVVTMIRDCVRETHAYDMPVAGVLTQVDELDPKRIEPPYEQQEKIRNIQIAKDAMEEAFKDSEISVLNVIPVSTYAEYQDGKIVYTNAWNVDKLVEYLVEVLPECAQIKLARLSAVKVVQRKAARMLIRATTGVCAAIAATPIPVGDLIPITAAQMAMITGIAYISGRELSKESAREFLTALGVNVGTAFTLREGARALAKFVFPGAGLVISGGVAAAGTYGIGRAATAFFIDKKSIEEAIRISRMDPATEDKEGLEL